MAEVLTSSEGNVKKERICSVLMLYVSSRVCLCVNIENLSYVIYR